MPVVEVFGVIISSIVFIVSSIVWHELGHIIALIRWSKDLIIIHIGKKDSFLKAERRVGRVLMKIHKDLCIFPSYCQFYNTDISKKHRLYTILAGPFMTFLFIVILKGAYYEADILWLKQGLKIGILFNFLVLLTAIVPFKLSCGAESDAKRFWSQFLQK